MLEIAIREAKGNGSLYTDFKNWLIWNYELFREHCSVLMSDEHGLSARHIHELMNDILNEKYPNEASFNAALTEYDHVKETLRKRTLHYSTDDEIQFSIFNLYFSNEWRKFENDVQEASKPVELQNREIDAAIELVNLEQKRTFLQQMAKKIGEIYESIRHKLQQIRNNGFTLSQAVLNPICSPVESDNPSKTAILVIGSVAISIGIGAVAGAVGTALYADTSVFSMTVADSVVGGIALTSTTLTAVGGKAARESALEVKKAINNELLQRSHSLAQFKVEEEEYRKRAREEMTDKRKKAELARRQTSLMLVNSDANCTNQQEYGRSAIVNDEDRLADAAQEMQFATEDISRELIETYKEERNINDLKNVIQQAQQVKDAIKQKQNGAIKSVAKALVTTLNNQDRFEDAERTLNALKRQDLRGIRKSC
ncbi:unnamed protein product [Didymodactylos carnosus]|uniref:Uncharacterized protein n=1 Tax=Didymodactylos carnosus TaxID=1234261 RepID=A0A814HT24_9BILA|nr:unnamed protein product [Didymodactylos carnosus]CAF3787120.1 unnamed protein product [Didymodactylos carnosus]